MTLLTCKSNDENYRPVGPFFPLEKQKEKERKMPHYSQNVMSSKIS
jgi:hypothetical protein